jgi:TRAP-type transport system periplasmic protein
VVGKFPGTSVVSLPFLTESARNGSMALWKLYETGVLANEYSETVPISLFTFPPSNIHTKKPVRTLEDLKGLQIGATSDSDADLLKRFGAVPVSLSIAEFYQAANQGVVAGVASPWTGVTNFKLHEVLPYHLEVPMGLSPGFMLMNKKAFAALPENMKTLLSKNSGYELSKRVGRVYGEEIARDQYNEVVKLGGHTMTKLEGAEAERWRKLAEPQIEAWLARDPNRGKILDAYRAALTAADKDK